MELTFQYYLSIMHTRSRKIHHGSVWVLYKGVCMNVSWEMWWEGGCHLLYVPLYDSLHIPQNLLCVCVQKLDQLCGALMPVGVIWHYPNAHETRSERKGTVKMWECITSDPRAISWWVSAVVLLQSRRRSSLLLNLVSCVTKGVPHIAPHASAVSAIEKKEEKQF